MGRNGDETGALVIGAILIIAAIIAVMKSVFPYFFWGGVLFLALTIVCLLLGADGDIITLIGGLFVVCLIGALISYGIGYGFGESSVGKAITDVAGVFNLVNDIEKNATLTVIDASQQTTIETIRATNSTNPPNLEETVNQSYDILRIATEIG